MTAGTEGVVAGMASTTAPDPFLAAPAGSAEAAKPAGDACLECPLRYAPCVPPETHPGAKLAVVGEAPGFNEVEHKRPFVGASGRVMVQALAKIGLSREDVHWTNAVLCECHSEKLLGQARRHCAERLHAELSKAGVEHIVPVGAQALHTVGLLPRKPKILKWRGFVHTVRRDEGRAPWIVMPTVHPAFVMRAMQWEPVFACDMQRVGQVLHEGWVPPEKQGAKLVLARTIEGLREVLASMGPEVAVDVETTGLEAMTTNLVCLGISDGSTALVVPWSLDKHGTCCAFGTRQREAARVLTEFFAGRVAVTHNGPAFDHIVLEQHGIMLGRWEDSLLAHHAFAGHMPKSLGHVVSMYLDAPPWKEEPHDDNLKVLYKYNARDVLYTARAWQAMRSEVAAEASVYEQDKISARICTDMQRVGIRFDVTLAKVLGRKLKVIERKCSKKAAKILGHEVNLLSQLQLRQAFFEELEAPKLYYSMKTRAPALHGVALAAYATLQGDSWRDLREFVEVLSVYRRARKIRSTYIEAITPSPSSRVHPAWLSYGAVSGRFACQNPNLMNLPRPENDPVKHLGGIRSLYTASKGNVLVGFDFSQLEMRIAAYVSGDEVMIAACESSDLHAANAAVIFGEAFTKAEYKGPEYTMFRNLAKQSGFAIAYMAGADTVYKRILAAGIPVTLLQTERMLAKMRKTFRQYYAFQEQLLLNTIKTGYVRIPISGRKRWLGHTPKAPECANTPIQGGAAGLMNMRLPQMVARLPRGAHLVAQVHDAGYFDVPARHADSVAAMLKEVAEEPLEINGRKAVFPIDVKIGERWSDL